jgi:integrase
MSQHGQRVAGHKNLQFWGPNDFIRVRIAVPPELVKLVGKTELVKGLGTQCVAEAVRRSRGWIDKFNGQIDAARVQAGTASERVIERLSHMTLRALPYDAQQAVATLPPPQAMPILRTLLDEPEAMPLASITYEAAVDLWVASKGTAPPEDTTIGVYRGHLARLFDRLGHDEMNRVTEADILAHPQVLLSGSDGKRPIVNKSVNNHMASIRAVFRVAKFERKITHDPTVGTIKKLKVGKRRRKEFSREQHAQIIAAARNADDVAIKWLWLIGCLTGARIGELADATVDAVQQVAGHWALNINEDHRRIWHGKPIPLKTAESTRKVPLHSAILKAGFLDYVAEVRAAHGDRAPLFPNFAANRYGRFSDNASRKCLAWLREVVGIYAGPNVYVFHSTRHCIKSFLRGRVPDEVSNAITGHLTAGVGAQYGETEVIIMARAVEKIRVLPHEGAAAEGSSGVRQNFVARGSRRVAA